MVKPLFGLLVAMGINVINNNDKFLGEKKVFWYLFMQIQFQRLFEPFCWMSIMFMLPAHSPLVSFTFCYPNSFVNTRH